jgi:hypothetical protein
MWCYVQRTGALLDDAGRAAGYGYSGSGAGKDAPGRQDEPDEGPIPQGYYTIGPPECIAAPGPHGPFVLRLTPDAANEMYGRSGFLIHGDGLGPHAGDASHGCIVLPRSVRVAMAASGDNRLRVVAEFGAILPATEGTQHV